MHSWILHRTQPFQLAAQLEVLSDVGRAWWSESLIFGPCFLHGYNLPNHPPSPLIMVRFQVTTQRLYALVEKCWSWMTCFLSMLGHPGVNHNLQQLDSPQTQVPTCEIGCTIFSSWIKASAFSLSCFSSETFDSWYQTSESGSYPQPLCQHWDFLLCMNRHATCALSQQQCLLRLELTSSHSWGWWRACTAYAGLCVVDVDSICQSWRPGDRRHTLLNVENIVPLDLRQRNVETVESVYWEMEAEVVLLDDTQYSIVCPHNAFRGFYDFYICFIMFYS